MNRGIEASFESEVFEELRRENAERREQAEKARFCQKVADIIAFVFGADAVLVLGTFDGSDKLFVGALVALLVMSAITAHFFALAYKEEADELGEGWEPWQR